MARKHIPTDTPNRIKLKEGLDWINENFTELYDDKLDKGGYTGTAQDLKDDVDGTISGYKGAISISDTPTQDGIYTPTQEGTYPNAGGLTYNPSTTDKGYNITFIKTGSSWVKNRVDTTKSKESQALEPYIRESYNLLDTPNLIQSGSWTTLGVYSPSNNTVSLKKQPLNFSGVTTLSGHGTVGTSLARIVYFDINGDFLEAVIAGTTYNNTHTFQLPTPPTGAYYYGLNIAGGAGVGLDLENSPFLNTLMLNLGSIELEFEKYGYTLKTDDELNNIYVDSVNGSDLNNGSFISPYKTLIKVLEEEKDKSKNIILADGDYSISATYFSYLDGWTIKSNGNARIISGLHITEDEHVSGKVYKATIPLPTKNQDQQLWQHDIPDESTLIDVEDRHPKQKDEVYRLSSTRLYKVNSISEIENSSEPSWYHDGSTFYFSKVAGSDLSVNPIVVPEIAIIIDTSITLKGVKLLYTGFVNLHHKKVKYNIIDSSIMFTNVDPLSNQNSESYVENSRICGVYNNGIGYGISAIGEEVNCWIHDCLDEGSSAHGDAKVIRKNGFYEFNNAPFVDVGNVSIYMENMLFLKNDNNGNFSFSGSKANGTLFNCGTDKAFTANITGRVKAINCRATLFQNITEI